MSRTMACDGASTGSAALAGAKVAAQHLVDSSSPAGPVGQVGLEIEAHCYDLAVPSRRPGWDELTAAISAIPPLPGGSAVTVEPGGAVELSGPPLSDAATAISAMRSDRAVLCASFGQARLGLALLGADPLRPPARVNPGVRYQAMEKFFRASQTGAAGAAMMTSTASIQVNVEAGPREGWADRVRLAHALGPTMIAIAAKKDTERHGNRAGPRWLGNVGIVGAAPSEVPAADDGAAAGPLDDPGRSDAS